jgi:hypothetical protein
MDNPEGGKPQPITRNPFWDIKYRLMQSHIGIKKLDIAEALFYLDRIKEDEEIKRAILEEEDE